MPRKCSACINPSRAEIDRALLAGASLRGISRQVALSKDAIARHRPHVDMVLVKAREATEARHCDALSSRLEELSSRARRLADAAEARKDTRDSLLALREMSRLIEIEARIAGRIEGTRVEVSLTNIKIDLLTDEQIDAFFQRVGPDRRARIVGREINRLISDEDAERIGRTSLTSSLYRDTGYIIQYDDLVEIVRAAKTNGIDRMGAPESTQETSSASETSAALVPAVTVQSDTVTRAPAAQVVDIRARLLARLDDYRR